MYFPLAGLGAPLFPIPSSDSSWSDLKPAAVRAGGATGCLERSQKLVAACPSQGENRAGAGLTQGDKELVSLALHGLVFPNFWVPLSYLQLGFASTQASWI